MRARWREEGRGRDRWRDSQRMKEAQTERRCRDNKKKKKEDQRLFHIHILKDKPSSISVQPSGICGDKEDCVICSDNDGEKHNLSWGVVFKVAEKMRDAGVRLPIPSSPPSARSNLPWGCAFTRRWGFGGCIGCCGERKAGMKS